jgi:hypothetical protein
MNSCMVHDILFHTFFMLVIYFQISKLVTKFVVLSIEQLTLRAKTPLSLSLGQEFFIMQGVKMENLCFIVQRQQVF